MTSGGRDGCGGARGDAVDEQREGPGEEVGRHGVCAVEHMFGSEPGAEGVDDERELCGRHADRLLQASGAVGDDRLQSASHRRGSGGQLTSERVVARRVREELQLQRAPLRVAGHRVERVLGRQLSEPARLRRVGIAGGGEEAAQFTASLGAAPFEQGEEQLVVAAKW
jgi:hypothetical protein